MKPQVDCALLRQYFKNTFIILLLFHSCQSFNDKTTLCEKRSACICEFSDGEGIDLSKLSNNLFWLNTTDDAKKLTFYFHPCTNIPSLGENECSKGASMCLYNKTSNNFTLLGKAEDATFISEGVDDIFIKYTVDKKITIINLQCRPGISSTLELAPPGVNQTDYKFNLISPLACPVKTAAGTGDVGSSLSTGSVLVIIFFTFAGAYLIIGAVVLKVTRGAEGKELIPNLEFWTGLPSLCRDGMLFAVSGCKQAPRTYDSI